VDSNWFTINPRDGEVWFSTDNELSFVGVFGKSSYCLEENKAAISSAPFMPPFSYSEVGVLGGMSL